jgi:uncharacterized Zn finger protein (UPF0148 family)
MEKCDRCGVAEKADGWRLCPSCLDASARQTASERRRKTREGRQRIGAKSNSPSLFSAERDEQVGGMSRAVRAMEDNG